MGKCSICGELTWLCCSDCAIDLVNVPGADWHVYVCRKPECQGAHEAKVHGAKHGDA